MIRLGKHPELRWVIGGAIAFWLIGAALVLIRYYGVYPSYATFDQGIFNQVFWNSLQGDWFQSSLSSTESIAVMGDRALPDVTYHRLGQHFTPSLLLWLPFYALFPGVPGLAILQVTLVAAAGLLVYALARHYLPPRLSMVIGLSYYAANAVIGPTLANFHDFSQIPLFVFGLLLALEKRWWGWFGLLSGLTLLVREDAGVILLGIGLYLIGSRRYPWLGAGLCVASLGYMLALTNLIMPQFSDDISRRFMVEEFRPFIGDRQTSTLGVLWAILSQPWILVSEIVSPVGRSLRYLLAQWLPLVFIPAISPSTWALTSLPLIKILLQQNPSALSIDRRFAITLVPGLFYGTILWWSVHASQWKSRLRHIWMGCLILSLLLVLTSNPNRALSFALPDSIQPWVYTSPTRQWQHAQAIRQLLAQIPPDASVSATSFIVPHVSSRRAVLRFPQVELRNEQREAMEVEYAIADLWQFQQYQSAFPWEDTQLKRSVQMMERLLKRDRYGLIQFTDGVALLQRDTPSNPSARQAWTAYSATLLR